MTIPVLVVDADEEYRNLTAKTLDGTGQYRAFPADSAKTALPLLSSSQAQIAIVDIEISDLNGIELIRQLQQRNKHLLVIAVVDDETTQSQELMEMGVRSILEKPFYLPELPGIIKSAIQAPSLPQKNQSEVKVTPEKPQSIKDTGLPRWLLDQDQASDFLTRLFNEHSAQALLIIRGSNLWARSHQLSDDQAKQVALMLLENEQDPKSKDSIVRYIHLDELEVGFLLYAIQLKEDYKLVLLYDSEKSFSIVRRQAKYISQLILTQDPGSLPPPESRVLEEAAAVPREQPQDSTLPSDWIPQSPASVEDFPQLSDLNISPADPEIGILEETIAAAPIAAVLPSLPTDWFPKRPTPTSQLPFLAPEEPVGLSHSEAQSDIQTQHQVRYHLPFSAVLIPHLPSHQLNDQLAEKVVTWVQDICLAWGWRADKVQTAKDHLRFTLNLSPDTAPSIAVQHLVNALSKQILATNPELLKDLPSDQFWAKHYLLIAGGEIEPERIRTFIQASRQDPGTTPLGTS